MSSAAAEPIERPSPRLKARIAGVFYLLTFLTGGLALATAGSLVVSGDAAATAANILAHEPSLWFGYAFDLLMFACYIAVTAFFYDLFTPVKRSLSLLAAFFSLVSRRWRSCGTGRAGSRWSSCGR
jgi:hypothetical protein